MINLNQKYRIEQDSIGTMEVPMEAYYGVHSLRAKQNFPISGSGMHEVCHIKVERSTNLFDATEQMDFFVEFSHALKSAAITLSKFANDIRLLSSGPWVWRNRCWTSY